jgi:hypothetical protein
MNDEKLRPQAAGILAGYVIQFLAGMLLNLFVTIPNSHPGSSGSMYFSRSFHSLVWTMSGAGGWVLGFHVYLGILLVIGSTFLCINAYFLRDKKWSVVGGIAALLTIGALFNGLSFVNYNKNISSMIMAVCWLGAVGSITYGLVNFKSININNNRPLKFKKQ